MIIRNVKDFKTADMFEPSSTHTERPLAPRGREPRTFEATALTRVITGTAFCS